MKNNKPVERDWEMMYESAAMAASAWQMDAERYLKNVDIWMEETAKAKAELSSIKSRWHVVLLGLALGMTGLAVLAYFS